jgi:hypothetical protein
MANIEAFQLIAVEPGYKRNSGFVGFRGEDMLKNFNRWAKRTFNGKDTLSLHGHIFLVY